MSAPTVPPGDPVLQGHGFDVRLPGAWEGRIYRRAIPVVPFTAENRAGQARVEPGGSGEGWLGEDTRPVVHLATFGLPAERGDYGSGAVEIMTGDDAFVSLLEFGPECLGTALFAGVGMPRVRAAQFDPNGLQRTLPGQAGCQFFFTENSRPLCLYVVIGSQQRATRLADQVNTVLDRVSVAAP